MADPLVTKEKRLALLERLACRLNDMKRIVGVGVPAPELDALVSVLVSMRAECMKAREFRAKAGVK